jgi:hypothetical protein
VESAVEVFVPTMLKAAVPVLAPVDANIAVKSTPLYPFMSIMAE